MNFIKKNKVLLVLLLFSLLFIVSPAYIHADETVQEEETDNAQSEPEPTIEYTDFNNGTKLTTIDYQNGTKDVITETMLIRRSILQLGENTTNQMLEIETPTTTELATDWIPVTKEIILEQEIMMGFTWTILKKRYELVDIHINLWVVKGYVEAGVNIDIQMGLRLPFNIKLEYPEKMTALHEYTCFATLIPINKANFDEFLFTFKFYAYIRAGIWLPFVGWSRWSYTYGPNYDYSQSFKTPFGSGSSFPIGPLSFTIVNFGIMKLDLAMTPQIGSNKFTAKARTSGDATGGKDLTWTQPNQKLSFKVQAGDYGPTDYATIILDTFRYYFTIMKLAFSLVVNFNDLINKIIGDFWIYLYTFDLSAITKYLYLTAHEGYDPSVDVPVFVERFGTDVDIAPKNMYINTGDWGTFKVKVKNTGNVPDTFRLEVEDLAPDDYNLPVDEISLDPGEVGYVDLEVRQFLTEPGSHRFTVHCYSMKSLETCYFISDMIYAWIWLAPFYMPEISINPSSITTKPCEIIEYNIEVKNIGNMVDKFDISLEYLNFDEQWALLSKDKTELLAPGESESVLLTIMIPCDWAGMDPESYEFKATATSCTDPDNSDSMIGDFVVEPTKESKARYVDIELQELKISVLEAELDADLKESLLDHLIAAIKKKEQALDYIINDKMNNANNMLVACINIMNAFLSLVEAQFGQGIPEDLAYDWEHTAEIIIGHIEDTINTPC